MTREEFSVMISQEYNKINIKNTSSSSSPSLSSQHIIQELIPFLTYVMPKYINGEPIDWGQQLTMIGTRFLTFFPDTSFLSRSPPKIPYVHIRIPFPTFTLFNHILSLSEWSRDFPISEKDIMFQFKYDHFYKGQLNKNKAFFIFQTLEDGTSSSMSKSQVANLYFHNTEDMNEFFDTMNRNDRTKINEFFFRSVHYIESWFSVEKEYLDMESIFHNERVISELKRLIHVSRNEKKSRAIYHKKSTGLVLHGPPGTGKSYLARSLAFSLGYDIVNIPKSEDLIKTINQMYNLRPERYVFIFDDADFLNLENREAVNRKEKSNTNLSSLMEFLDQDVFEGSVCIFTTNHIEKFDPALFRCGRISAKIHVEPLRDGWDALFQKILDLPGKQWRIHFTPEEVHYLLEGHMTLAEITNNHVLPFQHSLPQFIQSLKEFIHSQLTLPVPVLSPDILPHFDSEMYWC
jgi:hypothetical protein